jgi:hypothetical protein
MRFSFNNMLKVNPYLKKVEILNLVALIRYTIIKLNHCQTLYEIFHSTITSFRAQCFHSGGAYIY